MTLRVAGPALVGSSAMATCVVAAAITDAMKSRRFIRPPKVSTLCTQVKDWRPAIRSLADNYLLHAPFALDDPAPPMCTKRSFPRLPFHLARRPPRPSLSLRDGISHERGTDHGGHAAKSNDLSLKVHGETMPLSFS